MQTLEVTARDAKQNPDQLRAKGLMPAVMYGKDQAAVSVTVNTLAFEKAFKSAGYSSVIALAGAGAGKDVLVYDVAFHPVTSTPIHADLYMIAKGQTVEVEIPLVFTGTAPAEKEGAVVVRVRHSIELSAEPRNLPHELTVDLSALVHEGDQITVRDITLPANVSLVTDAEEVVASATAFKEEVVEAPAVVTTDATAAPAEGAAPAAPAAAAAEDKKA